MTSFTLRAALLAAFACLALLVVAPVARAGNFTVSPIRIELGPDRTSAVLKVRNDGAEPVIVQVNATAWSQTDGRDEYVPTEDLIATPPIVRIGAGAEQVVRVGLRRAADARNEMAYRVFVEEILPPPGPADRGIRVALRFGVPVFVLPEYKDAAPRLSWSLARASDGLLQLVLRNDGERHIQVSNLRLAAPGSEEPVAQMPSGAYVLPGQSRSFSLKADKPGAAPAPGGKMRLLAASDAGDIDTEMELAGR